MDLSAIAKYVLPALQRADLLGTSLVAASMALCALVAAEATSYLQYRSEHTSLAQYATQLVDREHGLGVEAASGILRIAANGHTPCSDADLADLRDVVVASEHLRDAGRVGENGVRCSALHGRFADPVPIPQPDVVSSDGQWRTWNARWPILPPGVFGHFIESQGVWASINERTLKGQVDRSPSLLATEFLYDRRRQRLLHSFGPDVPLSPQEILASELVERNGTLFQPQCRTGTLVCMVVSEPVTSFHLRRRPLLMSRLLIGGVFGALLAFIVILLDLRQQSLEARLRRAIQLDQLSVAYQPIVDLQTEAIVGAEALVRWNGRDGRPISPEVFVPLAETRGFVGQLTRLVMRKVASELGDLLREGGFYVTLNVAPQDLIDPAFLPELERNFPAAGVPRSSVGIEVTERSSLDPSVAVEALATLKRAGYWLYIDDFGTGYSSLSYLHRLSVHALKIDRIFTQTIGTGSVTDSVVPQILAMARTLNLQVVVEGVETRAQADYFRTALPEGRAQGWLFGRPVPANALRKLLEEDRAPILYAS